MDKELKLMTAHHISSHFYTLITGASSRIGKAFAEECARRKMNLFLVVLPDTGLENLLPELLKNSRSKQFVWLLT